MELRFDGKIAIVTGGASGIGQAVAEAFAVSGARVIVTDINESGGAAVAKRLRDSGAEADFVPADMTNDHDVSALVDAVTTSNGGLDILVNVVGGAAKGDRPGIMLHEESEALWDETMALSLKSTFFGMKYAITYMLANGGGAIVNIASLAGLHVELTGTPAYGAAKAGVIHLTRTAAVMYGKHGIRINAVAPGLTLTPNVAAALTEKAKAEIMGRYPIVRGIAPSEQASAVLWLASDHAAMITGHILPVDGGQNAL